MFQIDSVFASFILIDNEGSIFWSIILKSDSEARMN